MRKIRMAETNAIQVYCRLKPLVIQNKEPFKYEIEKEKGRNILRFMSEKREEFRFKKVFDENATQSSIFEDVAVPILDKFLSGMNGTIFTYGQTGSGKTHTMYGTNIDKGIIPRSLKYIFDNSSTEELEISMSYIEIYNNELNDLLSSKNKNDKYGEYRIKNVTEALSLMKKGNEVKRVSRTSMNLKSSRSHCICQITYRINKNVSKLNPKYCVLNLVDLAGSERLSTSNNNPVTFTESRSINKSLLYLRMVINCLRKPTSEEKHVPYNNCSITRFLKYSLGFKCATAMITSVVLNQKNIKESISTCHYARDFYGVKHIISEEPVRKQTSVKLSVVNKFSRKTKKMQRGIGDQTDEMWDPRFMECGDGYCDKQKIINTNCYESQLKLNTRDINVQTDDVLDPRFMESGDDNKYIKNCETQTVVDSSNVCVMTDMQCNFMECGDGYCDKQKIINTNLYESQLKLNSRDINVQTADVLDPRFMQSGDDNKHFKNCETQTVVVSSNVSEVSVMTDIQCGDIINDSKRCRCGVVSVYRNCFLLFVIMAVIFIRMSKNDFESNAVRTYSFSETLVTCLKTGSCMENLAPEWLQTRRNPERSSAGHGNRRCHCYSCRHHSNFYSKTMDDKNDIDFETEHQNSKQKFPKWNILYIIYIVVVILIAMLLYKLFHMQAMINDLSSNNTINYNTITQLPTSLQTVFSTPENTAPAPQVTVSQFADEKPPNHIILKADENCEKIINSSLVEVTKQNNRRTSEFVNVGYGIWQRRYIHHIRPYK